ncbi:MAG: putative DNA-binding protein [Clostridiaceae bacterium]|nr:putative DNA-binding protein [Clostridiaceae bacterium]
MEECAQISMLLDFYGQLLTKRQYEILDLHYNGDCSLGEIAGQLNISRQGVYDGVKKGKEALKAYEKKLGLVSRFTKHEKNLRSILENLKEMKNMDNKDNLNDMIDICVKELEKVIIEL